MDSNTTDTFKAQKGSKDIIKIVSGSILILWWYFLCTMKTKIKTLFKNLFSMSELNVHDSTTTRVHSFIFL